ncbi:hypothetical protein SBA2_800018 [Acidobacteriia bacterium SbA2]|nr:hypothetical protein SBA2_800018 [Acidobacteriia bacterium SbA2]
MGSPGGCAHGPYRTFPHPVRILALALGAAVEVFAHSGFCAHLPAPRDRSIDLGEIPEPGRLAWPAPHRAHHIPTRANGVEVIRGRGGSRTAPTSMIRWKNLSGFLATRPSVC